jgi:hypothetical protein
MDGLWQLPHLRVYDARARKRGLAPAAPFGGCLSPFPWKLSSTMIVKALNPVAEAGNILSALRMPEFILD